MKTIFSTTSSGKSKGMHSDCGYNAFRIDNYPSQRVTPLWVAPKMAPSVPSEHAPQDYQNLKFTNTSSRRTRKVSPKASRPSKSKSKDYYAPQEPVTPPPPTHSYGIPAHAVVNHPYARPHPPRRPVPQSEGESYDMFLASYHRTVDGMTASWS
ncbi:hypothetical protein FA95DRAFT_1600801 [Auriscalpium vulgare]|uniref:Uncharacterized protein n=1 Tax=Auriscalpium vulgare TaxID=40419 RepID=A0ACB8SBT8_9AGAM|nr:hypothetical protein FA95DRAFT_1600801 [Auriscalpium vulgare]